MLLSIITRFIFLNFYPFVSFGDEVRDGGHDAYEIYQKRLPIFLPTAVIIPTA